MFFRLLPAAGGLFVVTILALVATMFSDPAAPAVQFLDAHGGMLIAAEAGLLVFLAFLAMAADRREILRAEHGDRLPERSNGEGSGQEAGG